MIVYFILPPQFWVHHCNTSQLTETPAKLTISNSLSRNGFNTTGTSFALCSGRASSERRLFEGELDVVAVHLAHKHLLHVDAHSMRLHRPRERPTWRRSSNVGAPATCSGPAFQRRHAFSSA